MLYKATISFSGKISMAMGDIREIEDASLVDDLLKAGYIVPRETELAEKEEKPKKKTTKGKGKAKNED